MKKKNITTYLEILDRDLINVKVCEDPQFRVDECVVDQWQLNKFLYQYVGGPWQWKGRLTHTEQQWSEFATNPKMRTWVAYHCGNVAGYYELIKDDERNVEIKHLGMMPDFIGKGLGGPMLSHAILSGFDWDAKRVWLHTCTMDHEYAKANYLSRGMKVYKVETEEE